MAGERPPAILKCPSRDAFGSGPRSLYHGELSPTGSAISSEIHGAGVGVVAHDVQIITDGEVCGWKKEKKLNQGDHEWPKHQEITENIGPART